MASITLHLSLRNFLSIVMGVCVVALALIPLLVPASQLGWTRWKTAVIVFAFIAVAALIIQAFVLSNEEHDSKVERAAINKRLADLIGAGQQQGITHLSEWLELYREQQKLEDDLMSLDAKAPSILVRGFLALGDDSVRILSERIEGKRNAIKEIKERMKRIV